MNKRKNGLTSATLANLLIFVDWQKRACAGVWGLNWKMNNWNSFKLWVKSRP